MELKPITRQEKIIAGENLTPITRMEKFLKNFVVGSVPKPLTYDYMPEGYPKKYGWSIEWDGNTEGKIVVGSGESQFYKFSDMVLSADDLLGATVILSDPDKTTGTVTNVTIDLSSDDIIGIQLEVVFNDPLGLYFVCVRKDNAYLEGLTFPEKGLYIPGGTPGFMMSKELITPMSTDFLPKNLNVVFTSKSGTDIPTNCNVTYDELRGWVERGVPVFSAFIHTAGSKYVINNITEIVLFTDRLEFSFYNDVGKIKVFAYKSDGTIEAF